MNDSGDAGSRRIPVSEPGNRNASRVFCVVCHSQLIADPDRKGISICPACHTVRKADNRLFPQGSEVGSYRFLGKNRHREAWASFICAVLRMIFPANWC